MCSYNACILKVHFVVETIGMQASRIFCKGLVVTGGGEGNESKYYILHVDIYM